MSNSRPRLNATFIPKKHSLRSSRRGVPPQALVSYDSWYQAGRRPESNGSDGPPTTCGIGWTRSNASNTVASQSDAGTPSSSVKATRSVAAASSPAFLACDTPCLVSSR